MKKFLLLFVLYILCPLALVSQNQGYMKETFNSENYPEVSFVWHDDGVNILHASDVRYLKENGLQREFAMQQIQPASSECGKHIVILWEDFREMSNGKDIRVGQHDFIKSVISRFLLSGKLSPNDYVMVAEFHRSTNTSTVMRPLYSNFTNDHGYLESLVSNHTHSSRAFEKAPNTSDLYTAVREAIELLNKLPEADESKAVFLFTAGHPRNVPGADSADQVLLLAQKLNIPVYILQYAPRSGVALETDNFAKATKGGFRSFMQEREGDACSFMKSSYDNIDEAYFGHDYRFTYVTNLKRGGDPQTVAFNINGVEYQEQYMPPAFSLKEWIKENPILFALIVLLLLILIAVAVVLSVVSHRKKARKLKQLEQQQKDAEAEAQKAIIDANNALGDYKRQQEQERIAEEQRVEQERLLTLMRNKNVFPRLVCDVDGIKSSSDVTKPLFTIGRNPDNDMVLNNSTVSRHHAKITYDGYGFYIIDLNSANHVVVNGAVLSHSLLRSGDVIELGEAKIIFYL